jgi:hypothetical protein
MGPDSSSTAGVRALKKKELFPLPR